MAYCNQAWLGLVRNLGNHLNCAAARLLLVACANQALEMKLDPDGFATPMCIKKHWQTSVSAEGISSEGGSGVPNFLHRPPLTPSISYSPANTKSQSQLKRSIWSMSAWENVVQNQAYFTTGVGFDAVLLKKQLVCSDWLRRPCCSSLQPISKGKRNEQKPEFGYNCS